MTPTRPVARIAHHGNSYASLENTLDASASAMKIGCDWLELDVRTTRDGRVVLHDETLWRLWGQRTGLAAFFSISASTASFDTGWTGRGRC